MKKLFAIVLAAMLLIVPMSLSASAEGALNDSEQKILTALRQSADINGKTFIVPTNYVNQAENYFKTIDVTEEQADEVLGYIARGIEILKASNITTTSDLKILPKADRAEILSLGQKACAAVGATLTYDGTNVNIVDNATGTSVFSAAPIVKTTGAEVDYTAVVLSVCAVVLVLGAAFAVSKKTGLLVK